MKNILIALLMTIATFSSALAADSSPLKRTESKFICMVTNKPYDTPQIAVSVADKTYYGCCQACKATLENDPSSRQAIDPVSKKTVDKSTAVIGVSPDKNVYYFESEENMKKFGAGK